MEKLRKFFGLNWAEELKDFITGPEFASIGRKLSAVKQRNVKLTPFESNIFKAFEKCPWHKLHTIILGNHPYIATKVDSKGGLPYDIPLADGLAFSAPQTFVAPRQLNMLYEALDEEVFEEGNLNIGVNNDLSCWAREGILLLNCSLTSTQGRFDRIHYDIWRPFISYVLKTVNEKKDGIGVILLGEEAQTFKDLLDNSTFGVYSAEHPATAVAASRRWISNNVFSSLTGYHKFLNNIDIKWY